MRLLTTFILLLCIGLLPTKVSPLDLSIQRAAYLQAEYALRHNQPVQFLILSNSLRGYPLYPYLIYADLSKRMPQVSEKEVSSFLQEYADTPLAGKLRSLWLQGLVQQKKWALFLKYYQPTDDVVLQCQNLQALLNVGKKPEAFQLIPSLWLAETLQPPACEAAFVTWYQAGKLSQASIWDRVRLAIAKNDTQLLKKLSNWSTPDQQKQILLWQQVSKNPALVNNTNLFKQQDAKTREILIDGFVRWSKKNPQLVSNVWSKLKTIYGFTECDQQTIQRALAIALARTNDPNAASWLASIKPIYADQRVREWQIRGALIKANWQQVNNWIAQLSPGDRAQSIWRYWNARALEALCQTAAAQSIYTDLAKKVDYYGLLASQRLAQTYKPTNSFVNLNASAVTDIPAIQRAQELYILNRLPDARREWQWALDHMTPNQLSGASGLAFQWGWYDRAIVAAAKAKDWNNLTVRFPLVYKPDVIAAAQQTGLDPAWVYAIMRQESTFMTDARSVVGALGLMQLMPNTAKVLAKININETEILNKNTNIVLGARYLKQLSGWYKGNIIIASAAYNLGPTRLQKFIPLYNTLPTDIWVEILPWQETRDYVKAILLNKAIYQQKLAQGAKS